MTFVWATRGRTWGFRFLVTGGHADPLRVYDQVFADLGDAPEAWQRVGTSGALRFPDPLGRRDRAGRVIPHEFVVLEPGAADIVSVEDGRDRLWPEVAAIFDEVYDLPGPPAPRS